MPTVKGFSPSADYLAAKQFADAHGVPVKPGEVTVMAVRRGGDRISSDRYEDEFVVFKKDGTLDRFEANTKPAQMPAEGSSKVPDVNGDGKKDLGIVRPGNYMAYGDGGRTFGDAVGLSRPAFRLSSTSKGDSVPAWRDTNQDGVFSDEEKRASERANHTIGNVRIHIGFDEGGTETPQGVFVGPWSVGCQNVPNSQMDRFVEDVGGRNATFRYSIVED